MRRLLILLLLITPVFAAEPLYLNLESAKRLYSVSDVLELNVTVRNLVDTPFDYLELMSYLHGECPLDLFEENFSLGPGETKVFKVHSLAINEYDFGRRCTVIMAVFDSEGDRVVQKEFPLIIQGIPGKIGLSLRACRDFGCGDLTSVFTKGQTAYLDYSSGVDNLLINATLYYPDNSGERIELPASLKLEETGTYRLFASAAKDGYFSEDSEKAFAVIGRSSLEEGQDSFSPDAFLILGGLLVAVLLVWTAKKGLNKR